MSGDIEYASVEVPEAESPENYSWQARRAEILQLIEEAGHPRALNQSRLADRYGCTRQNINNDFDVLAEYVEENLGGRQALVAQNVFQRCIDELLEEGEWRDAARTTKEWTDWLTDHRDAAEMEKRITELEELAERAQAENTAGAGVTVDEEWR